MQILNNIKSKLIYIKNSDINYIYIFLLNIILSILMISIQIFIFFYNTNVSPIFILAFCLLLWFCFFINFYDLIKTIKLKVLSKKLENLQNYNDTLSASYDNIRAFKHDFENIINTIGGYIDSNDLNGLKQFYKGIAMDCKKINNTDLLNPNVINNSGIFNLLMIKYNKSQKLNVKMNIDFFFDFNKIKIPIYEFSRMFGILLDNAIEAAANSKEKEVNITFRDSSKNHVQLIYIENTYINNNINIDKIFEKGISGKKNHSGIGLWEVKEILKKLNNTNLITTNDKKYFKQRFEIFY